MKEQYIIENYADLVSAHRQSLTAMQLTSGDCLFIMDMQNFFTSINSPAYLPSSAEIMPVINSIIDQFCHCGSSIVFTQHSNNSENAGMMKRRYRHMLDISDELFQLDHRINKNGIIINKHQFDAFYGTDLSRILEEGGIKRLFICGVMIERCIESTARSSFVRGFETYVISDASATKNLDIHNASLMSMEEAGIEIINSGYFHA